MAEGVGGNRALQVDLLAFSLLHGLQVLRPSVERVSRSGGRDTAQDRTVAGMESLPYAPLTGYAVAQ